MRGIDGGWMQDLHFFGGCLRVFWRWPLRRLRNNLPYAFHDFGLYAFGVGPMGFMFWPPRPAEADLTEGEKA